MNDNPQTLGYWRPKAIEAITRFYEDDEFNQKVVRETLPGESLGPFTKFLYWFASECSCGWGVMIDFDERRQRVFLPNHYYQWMHKLRDELDIANPIENNKK